MKKTIKRPVTRDEAISTTLGFIRVQLKKRGDDPNSYNQKFLASIAEKTTDDYFREFGNYGIERLEEIEI